MQLAVALRRATSFLAIAMFAAFPSATAFAQRGRGADSAAIAAVKARYRKIEARIPMRDGARLFTSIYIPRDTSRMYPFLMSRTPYGIGAPNPNEYRPSLGLGQPYMDAGMIFVYQDARGRFYSEGDYTEMTPHKDVKKSSMDVDESTDSYDTIDWLVKNVPHNNGRVGIYGTSYPGFYTTASCIDPHPALKACAPGSPMTDIAMGDDEFHNGAFYLGANFSFYQGYGRTPRNPELGPDPRYDRPPASNDAYKFFLDMGPLGRGTRKYLPPENAPLWNLVLAHPNYDEFWQARNIRPHLKKVAPAMLEIGGFYDAEDLFGPFGTYRAIEQLSGSAGNAGNHLAIGPWSHGGWARGDGDALFTLHWQSKTGPWFRDSIEFPFFMHHLAGGPDPKLPKVLIFRTGADTWDRYDAFPPKSAMKKALYLQAGGKLAFTQRQAGAAPHDEYVSDPANPVPVVGRVDANGMPRDYMVGDQRFASKRADVLTYVSEVLTEDVTFAGPVSPVLHVSTSGTDADFDVKLIDVWPDDAPNWAGDTSGFKVAGYQQLVRGEPFRGRFRRSFARPVAFVPNQPDSLRFDMPDVNHTYRKGHRIMVQIQSSWFPLTDRNPQTFVPNIFEANPADFVKATMRVYHTPARASRIEVRVLSTAGVPDLPAAARAFPSDSAVLAIIRQRVEEKRSAGIVVGILDADGRTRIVAYGDPGKGQPPLDGSSVFEIGSISKVFTSTVLAELVKEGKVKLEDPAQKFLPPGVRLPARNGKEITLGTLSQQNSGLPGMPTNFHPADRANPYADYTVQQMYDFLAGYQLARDPGESFEYSNLGVGLLGHVLSIATKQPYEEMERKRVWEPLGMTNTAIALTPWMKEHLALGHDEQGNIVKNWDLPTFAGAGAIRSTTVDMLKFAAANLHPERGKLQEAMAFAQEARSAAGGPNVSIGLNWITLRAGTDTIVWHNGGTGGYRTFLGLEPSKKIAVVVMTNTGGTGADDIGMHLLDPALPLAPKPAPPKQRTAIELSAGKMSPYVGVYQLAPQFSLEITQKDGALYVRATGQETLRLWPETETDFFLKEVDAQVTFVRDAQGAVNQLVLHQNGANQPAKKMP